VSELTATTSIIQSRRLPLLPEWTMVAGITLLVGLVFLTGEHRWDRSSLKDYVESAEERAIAAVSGNDLRRIAFLAIGGAGLGLLLIGRRMPALREPMGLALVLACVWTFASVLWADSTSFTIKRLLLMTLCMGGTIGISSALSLRQLAIVLLSVSSSYLILGVVAEVLQGNFRPWAGGYRFAGTLHPNAQATNCGAMALAALALWQRRATDRTKRRLLFRQLMGCVFCVAVCCLLLTKSRTAAAAIITVLGLIWATRQKLGLNLILAGLGLLAILSLCFALSVMGGGDSVGEAANMGRADSQGAFNGRLPIWTTCIDRMGSKIPIGVGYDGFWTPDRIEDISWEIGWSISSVHSEYIELVLGLGVIGLLLYVAAQGGALLWFWLRYFRLGTGGDAMIFGLLLIGAVQGFMETGYLHPNALVPFLTLTGMLRLAFFTDRATAWQGAI